jgi:hypothetical protein
MNEIIVGRPKKPAQRKNYKITSQLLARLNAIAVLEDRSETAQLERFIREGSERWEADNPQLKNEYQQLINQYLKKLEGGDDEH